MKTAKRLQLFLSPVLIAMLTIMLAVVSFGWYQAMGSGEVEVEGDTVNITVEEPEGVEVTLTCIGDNYSYSDGTYTILNYGSDVVGYFGQTAEYSVSSDHNDKPYIVFYRVSMASTYVPIQFTGAYVDSLSIVKGVNTLVDNQTWVSEVVEQEDVLTKFTIKFFTSDDDGNTLTNESSSVGPLENKNEVVYMGIYFKDPTGSFFEYSDLMYYGSTYKLGITFIPQL